MNKTRSVRTQRLGDDESKTGFFSPVFSGPLDDLLYQRPSRKPVAYSNMVTKMSLTRSLVYKGKGKAGENQQGLVQYFRVTTPRSELSRGSVCAGRKAKKN